MDRPVDTTQVLTPTLSYVSGMSYDAVGQINQRGTANIFGRNRVCSAEKGLPGNGALWLGYKGCAGDDCG